jgi:hypothetical protein
MQTRFAEDPGISVKYFSDLAVLQAIAEDGTIQ